MAPNLDDKNTAFWQENSAAPVQIISKSTSLPQVLQPAVPESKSTPQYRWQIVWRNIAIFIYLHAAAIYGLYIGIGRAKWQTYTFFFVATYFAAVGVTAGSHRLWTHRTYKAKFSLRLFLAFWQTVALQNDILEWARDHRVHHKFTDTDADPHNASRGFFFSHIGWLLVKKHKDVMNKGKTVDLSDIAADPIVRFQQKYYVILSGLCCFGFTTFVPVYFWNENLILAFHFVAVARYVIQLHVTWLVNSAAHIYGTRPYDKKVQATENTFVGYVGFGEGWHNYHHVFPWDYKTSELPYYSMNFTTQFIDFMCWLGLAYDLKTVSLDMIERRAQRTGDGTRKPLKAIDQLIDVVNNQSESVEHVWGWEDKDMTEEHKQWAKIYNPEEIKSA